MGELKDLRVERLNRLADGGEPSDCQRLRDAFEAFVSLQRERCLAGDISPGTLANHEAMLTGSTWMQIGDLPATVAGMRAAVDLMNRAYGSKTAKGHAARIRMALELFELDAKWRKAEMRLSGRAKIVDYTLRSDRDWLEMGEVESFASPLAQAAEPIGSCLFRAAGWLGCRISEAAATRPRDIQQIDGRWVWKATGSVQGSVRRPQTKTGVIRTVPLLPPAREAIRRAMWLFELKAGRKMGGDDPVFYWHEDMGFRGSKSWHNVFGRLRRRLSLPPACGTHGLRRGLITFARTVPEVSAGLIERATHQSPQGERAFLSHATAVYRGYERPQLMALCDEFDKLYAACLARS